MLQPMERTMLSRQRLRERRIRERLTELRRAAQRHRPVISVLLSCYNSIAHCVASCAHHDPSLLRACTIATPRTRQAANVACRFSTRRWPSFRETEPRRRDEPIMRCAFFANEVAILQRTEYASSEMSSMNRSPETRRMPVFADTLQTRMIGDVGIAILRELFERGERAWGDLVGHGRDVPLC
jgi:hypothetical protein